MTLEALAGQRLMVGFEGTVLDNDLKYLIDSIKIGGVVLFSRNVENPSQLKTLCSSIQNHARSCGLPPLIIAVDQEGGEVARLKAPFTLFPGNSKMRDEQDARHFATITAEELNSVGINMDLAPVLDIVPKNIQGVMSKRSFGHDPNWISRLGGEVVSKLQQNGIMAVVKHFPGIGRATLDPHDDWMTLNTDYSVLKTTDLVPFEDAVNRNVSGVMLSHLRYQQIDARWPASLSVKIAGDLLRRKMNYKGIVMTDDMDMGVIKKHYDIKTVVARVLMAKIDMMLICHRSPDIESAFETICRTLGDSAQIKSDALVSANRIYRQKKMYLENLFMCEKK